jgi:DNA-binding response OmpR family regulator
MIPCRPQRSQADRTRILVWAQRGSGLRRNLDRGEQGTEKPFSYPELQARVVALLRRGRRLAQQGPRVVPRLGHETAP